MYCVLCTFEFCMWSMERKMRRSFKICAFLNTCSTTVMVLHSNSAAAISSRMCAITSLVVRPEVRKTRFIL